MGVSQGATAGVVAAVGATMGWVIGSAITTENRSRVAEQRPRVDVSPRARGRLGLGAVLTF
jgi:hypothetical protein